MDNVLEHISEKDGEFVIKEIDRVLADDGVFLVGVPGIKGYNSDDDHKCYYSEGSLIDRLSEYSYEVSRVIHTPFYFPFGDRLFRQYCVYAAFRKNPSQS